MSHTEVWAVLLNSKEAASGMPIATMPEASRCIFGDHAWMFGEVQGRPYAHEAHAARSHWLAEGEVQLVVRRLGGQRGHRQPREQRLRHLFPRHPLHRTLDAATGRATALSPA